MIKLIASDLDGTLLQNGAESLNPEMFDIILKLKAKGILFVAASGRQYPSMKRLFLPVWRDIVFIGENGALVLYRDEVLVKKPVPREMGQHIIRDIQALGHEAVVSCKDYSYIAAGNPAFRDYLTQSLGNSMAVADDLLSLDGEYLKISAYVSQKNALKVASEYQARWGKKLHVAVAGKTWVDHGVACKGDALEALKARLGLERGEMMAFGDNFNDESMLRAVEHSYAMANAHESIKNISAHVCTRVEDTLQSLLLSQEENMHDMAWTGRLTSIISS